MRLTYKEMGLLLDAIVNENEMLLVDELIEYLDNTEGEFEFIEVEEEENEDN